MSYRRVGLLGWVALGRWWSSVALRRVTKRQSSASKINHYSKRIAQWLGRKGTSCDACITETKELTTASQHVTSSSVVHG